MPQRFLKMLAMVTIVFTFYVARAFCNLNQDATAVCNAKLFKSYSSQKLVETARDHQWSINFEHQNKTDTINIIALRVEFVNDVLSSTTGNGRFGDFAKGDLDEYLYYSPKDKKPAKYEFDALPHDSLYFSNQLEMAKSYFRKVSHGKLFIKSSIYPAGRGERGYQVPNSLPYYSPGYKKDSETNDQYYNRRLIGLMKFIKEAVLASVKDPSNSPFANIHYNAADKTFRDESGTKTVFLIFHAGASYLTNGGDGTGTFNDTPADFIDTFINGDYFKQCRDSLGIKENGIAVQGKNGPMTIDEIMMCSETANQDGVNWGIQGILVNQIARQLGIPDLFSTSSGMPGIGAFCIMDYAGYFAGKGFIPPYPSAWVRAFMGWDNVKTASIGANSKYNIKALTSVLDRDSTISNNDTTILLVPINDHEYYLVENRQRNLSGDKSAFSYDTLDDSIVIGGYPFNLNVDKSVLSATGIDQSNVIQKVKNNDIGIPSSGVLIWHVDENIIRDRIANNLINADSLYKGVSLVEADGVNDLGVSFQNAFYQLVLDYGGNEDVFPHSTIINKGNPEIIDSIGPYTQPSTRSNDGGQTYLKLKVSAGSASPGLEHYCLARGDKYHHIINYSDSTFAVNLSWDYLIPQWPKRAAPNKFYEPLLVNLDPDHTGKEFFLVDYSGKAYAWSSDTSNNPYNKKSTLVNRKDIYGNIAAIDTVAYLDSIPGVFTMPSSISDRVYIPSNTGKICLINSISSTSGISTDSIMLNAIPSTYVCNYHDSSWAIGCKGGRIIFGKGTDTISSIKLSSDSSVSALASIRESNSVAVIQNDGRLSICSPSKNAPDTSIVITTGIGPFSIITGDIDNDSSSEFIVADSRHGVWVYKKNLSLAPGWEKEPNDWCNAYFYSEESTIPTGPNRVKLPVNTSAPSLADIDKDGYLDILLGGTNGIYALNYKGVLVYNWPAYLDTRYSYQKGSVVSTPIVVNGKNRDPLVLFSSNTGDNVTFSINKIVKADKNKGTVWYKKEDGSIDSLKGFTKAEIDTMLTMNDSLVLPYVLPGGFIDAVNGKAKRPSSVIMNILQSSWPLTTGSSLVTSPLAGFSGSSETPDLFAVSKEGWIYRWQLPKEIMPDTLFWAQDGYDNGRSFSYGGSRLKSLVSGEEPISLFSYPNPVLVNKINDKVVFRYKFNGPATNVKLDIFSYTGFKIYSKNSMGIPPFELTGSYPGWNELAVPIKDFGPAVYRCRMEATISGKTQTKYWKMAVIK